MPLPPPPPQNAHSREVFKPNLNGEDAYTRHRRQVQVAQLYKSVTQDRQADLRTEFDILKDTHK